MRLSELLTTRGIENGDTQDLLAYAGYTHCLADGLYTLLPLGQRVLQRINTIFRHEMSRAGAHELTMPLLQPEKLWEKAIGEGQTRAESFGNELFRLANVPGERLILAPTHEEVAAIIGAACIRETHHFPQIIYQIQPRFRQQMCRIENGLLHTREFIMADAYSFHADRASLDSCYVSIKEAFSRIVSLCGVNAHVVSADTGAMGGEASEELVASLPAAASATAVLCSRCGYAASTEIAEFARMQFQDQAPLPLEEVPALDTLGTHRLIWVPFVAGGRIVLGVISSNELLNLNKFTKVLSRAGLKTDGLHPASAQELIDFGATYDWISLVRTPPSVFVVADEAVRCGLNFCMPALRPAHFLTNVNATRDFRVDLFADISAPGEGSACSRCGNALQTIRGVELGHVFKLGSRYAQAFGAHVDGRPMEMGCYGLGISRLMATIVEQLRDTRGIVWPERIAPFQAIIVPLHAAAGVPEVAEQLYRQLMASGIDVLLDDSDSRPDNKLAYANLLGIPVKILLRDEKRKDIVEIEERASSETHFTALRDVAELMHRRATRSLL